MDRELREMFEIKETEMTVPPTLPHELRNRIGRQRMVMGGLVAAAAMAVVIGGFAGARSLTSDEALPPAEEDSNVSSFVDTWTSRDLDGSIQTMVVRASGEDVHEIVVRDDSAGVCSGAPSTMRGTGRLDGAGELVIPSPTFTCDDGSEPKVESGPPLEEQLRGLTFVHDPETDTLTDSFEVVWRRPAGDTNDSSFVDTWTTTDADGRTRTMTIRASDEDAYEVTVHNPPALVCSGAPSTLTGTGQLFGSNDLIIRSPEITCDDGSEPNLVDDPAFLEEALRDLTFERDPESDIITNYSPLESRRVSGNGQVIYNGLTLVWSRADAENRIGDVSGWITYGDKRGIWARDLTSPEDPSDRVLLSSAPGTPIAWSPGGSKLLVGRDDLFVVNSDGTETRVTDTSGVDGGSFSPDGTAVVYAVTPECWWSSECGTERENTSSAIYVVDAEGGSPEVLLTPGSRRYPDTPGPGGPGRFETMVQEPKWSPDGSQIAYFDGMGDWGNSLRVMNSDGTGSRVVVENNGGEVAKNETLGAGHVDGLEWSPDGSQIAFSIEEHLYVVGVDGSGFRLLTDDAGTPYWSPDGSYIAYTRNDDGPGTLEILRLDDLEVQNFGDGGSGPWTAELQW